MSRSMSKMVEVRKLYTIKCQKCGAVSAPLFDLYSKGVASGKFREAGWVDGVCPACSQPKLKLSDAYSKLILKKITPNMQVLTEDQFHMKITSEGFDHHGVYTYTVAISVRGNSTPFKTVRFRKCDIFGEFGVVYKVDGKCCKIIAATPDTFKHITVEEAG